MTIEEAIRRGTKRLEGHECPDTSPYHETIELLGQAAGISGKDIFLHRDRRLTKDQELGFLALLERRRNHEPLAHITGRTRCLGREFAVSPATLIPRPATETLIEAAIGTQDPREETVIYDIGTGSGIIATSLAESLPHATVWASDTSLEALRIAEDNVARFGLRSRVGLRHGDLLEPFFLSLTHGSPVMIVANLPYLPTEMIDRLPPEIRLHEPIAALDGGTDGLERYRALLDQAGTRLHAPRLDIFLEILPEQHEVIEALTRNHWPARVTKRVFNDSGIQIGIHLSIPGA